MRKRLLILSTALGLALVTAVPSVAQEETSQPELDSSVPVERGDFDSYIVVMKAEPLVATEGQDNLQSSQAQNLGEQMKEEHAQVMEESGVPSENKVSDYVNAINGFAAAVTYNEAVKLADHKDVAFVVPDELYQATTDSSPGFLGLDGPGGAWRTGVTGKGVVVGVIDSGIWPEHPSFADKRLPAPPIDPLDEIVVDTPNGPYTIGTCDFGNSAHNPNDVPFTCNDKLVGARQVLPTYRRLIGATALEFDSARDDNGHGTHTASTAAGNARVQAEIFDRKLGRISGIAPDAHIIAYKGLGTQGGFGSDLALAIDIAVADGVDVINYSIGGSGVTLSADEVAFLFAAEAGVYVATSAGNTGPGAESIRNPGKVPWLTTVGANTQKRFWRGTIELGDGTELFGSSITPATDGSFPLVDAANAGDDLCRLNNLDESIVAGAIVLCRRGAPARLMASAEVARAGGVGVILYNNNDADNLFTDNFHIPTVMVDNTPGLAIKEYIAGAGGSATAEIRRTARKSTWPSAPSITGFSSRGPNVWPDVLKPDITAPGFQILAGNSPFPAPILGGTVSQVQGELFQSIAGTSMSSPHIAGLYALIKQANPNWSAAAARSALMTTAHQDVVDNDRVSPADPFDFGSGHADPGSAVRKGSAFQPGLVYDAGFDEYIGFLCDVSPTSVSATNCAALDMAGIPTEASDLNYPSITSANVPGIQTITRTVTSVAKENGNRRYTASIEAPPGYEVQVSPSTFTLRRGESATYEVTVRNISAPLGEWRFGSLTWKSQGRDYEVRSPIAVRGAAFEAPPVVSVTGTSGSSSLNVFFGYTGAYSAGAHGFAADTGQPGTVEHDADQTCQCNGTGGLGEVAHTFTLTGSAHLRITLNAADLVGAAPGTDIDLFLYRGTTLVASSGAPDTAEVINLPFPEDGNYTLWVHGWQVPDPSTGYQFHLWDVPEATGGGSLQIDSAPTSATNGTVGTLDFSWSGLEAGTSYLGAISHNTIEPLRLTLVEAGT
jgi:subtilisin family serine protease